MSKLLSKEYPYPRAPYGGGRMCPSNQPVEVGCVGYVMNLGPDELRLYPVEYQCGEIVRMAGSVLFLGQHFNVQCLLVDEFGSHRCSENEFCSYHVVENLTRGMMFQTVQFDDVPGEWVLYIVPEVEYERQPPYQPDTGPYAR